MPGAQVADGRGQPDRRLADPGAERGITAGLGSLLHQLLVTPLDRAVPLAEMDHPALGVRQDLDLDVARPVEVTSPRRPTRCRSGQRLVLGEREMLGELLGLPRDPHALPAATGRRLDQHRKPDLLGDRQRLVRISSMALANRAPSARRRWRGRRAAALSPIGRICSGRGPMKVSSEARQISANSRVFGEEAVARVDRIRPGNLGRGDDAGMFR